MVKPATWWTVVEDGLEADLNSDGESENGEVTELTVEHVMEVFKRITSVNTPSVNSRLALPFKKRPVKESSK